MALMKLIIYSILLILKNLPKPKGEELDEKKLIETLVESIPAELWETYVYRNTTSSTIVSSSLKSLPSPYFVISKAVDFKLCRNYLSYNDNFLMLLLTENAGNILPIIRELLSYKLVVARSRILVLSLERMTSKQLLNVYEQLWNLKIGNLKFIGNIDEVVSSYIFDPFHLEEESGLKKCTHFFLDGRINMNRKNLYISITESFPQSFMYNWQGQTYWTGRSIQKIPMLDNYCNASIILVYAKNNERQCVETIENCTYATMSPGMENDMVAGKSELSLSYRHVQPSVLLDYMQPFEDDPIRLLTPTAGNIPTFVTLVRIFNYSIYLRILIAFVIAIIPLYLSIKWRTRRSLLGYLVFRITFRLLGQYPRIEIIESGYLSGKIVLRLWDFLTMVLWALFTTYVISALIYPETYKNTKDPEKFLNSHPEMPIYGFTYLCDYTKRSDHNSTLFKQVKNRCIGTNRSTFFAHAFYTPYNKSLITYGELALALEVLINWATKSENAIIRTDPLMRAKSSLLSIRGSIYHKYLQNIAVASTESGIQLHWEAKARNVFRSSKIVLNVNVLKMDRFYPPFIILLIGYLLSIVIFIFEHCKHRIMGGFN